MLPLRTVLAPLALLATPVALADDVDVDPTGDAHGEILAVSGTGDADGFVAVSGTGASRTDTGHGAAAVSGTGPTEAVVSVSGTGDARGSIFTFSGANRCAYEDEPMVQCVAVSPSGDADGYWLAVSPDGAADAPWTGVSGTGDAQGYLAASGAGAARGELVSASGLGDAEGYLAATGAGDARGFLVAASGTGDAESSFVAVSAFGGASAPVAVSLRDVLP